MRSAAEYRLRRPANLAAGPGEVEPIIVFREIAMLLRRESVLGSITERSREKP